MPTHQNHPKGKAMPKGPHMMPMGGTPKAPPAKPKPKATKKR